MIIMSLSMPMNLILKSGNYIGRPTMCLLTKYLWSQNLLTFQV
jgi:hypothetical protein